MISNIWVHWKTTLGGAIVAAYGILLHGTNWKTLLHAAAVAFVGAIAQDPGASSSTATQAQQKQA